MLAGHSDLEVEIPVCPPTVAGVIGLNTVSGCYYFKKKKMLA